MVGGEYELSAGLGQKMMIMITMTMIMMMMIIIISMQEDGMKRVELFTLGRLKSFFSSGKQLSLISKSNLLDNLRRNSKSSILVLGTSRISMSQNPTTTRTAVMIKIVMIMVV